MSFRIRDTSFQPHSHTPVSTQLKIKKDEKDEKDEKDGNENKTNKGSKKLTKSSGFQIRYDVTNQSDYF